MAEVRLGITKLMDDAGRYLGRGNARVGIVANYNAVDEEATPIIRRLHGHPDIELSAIFSAEHGLWGCEQAGVTVGDLTDPYTGAKVYSLYGDTKKPTQEMLRSIDVLVFDGNDVGSRYWTYLSTMALCIEAAAEAGKPIIVTDRPNPLGGVAVEGNVLEMEHRSFVGFMSIPIRHGMTLGELARLFAEQSGIDVDLTVVAVDNWRRDMLFPATRHFWTATPNMPDFETALLYPGTCLFEGTNCSEGRGTTKPFRLIGAPWLDSVALADELNTMGILGARFRPAHFRPAFSKHSGEECEGVEVYITDATHIQPVYLGLCMLNAIRAQDPSRFEWIVPFIHHLAGSEQLTAWIDGGLAPGQILHEWRPQLEQFMEIRRRHLMYE